MVSIVDATREVVLPAMRRVFREGEVSALEVRHSEELEGSICLTLSAVGETFVDYVAESGFGWGQNRDLR